MCIYIYNIDMLMDDAFGIGLLVGVCFNTMKGTVFVFKLLFESCTNMIPFVFVHASQLQERRQT